MLAGGVGPIDENIVEELESLSMSSAAPKTSQPR